MKKELFYYGILALLFNTQLTNAQQHNQSLPSPMKAKMQQQFIKRDAYKNEVNKDNYVAGEILVKFKDDVQVPQKADNKGNSLRSSPASPLQQAFNEIGVKQIKALNKYQKVESRSSAVTKSNTFKISFDTTLMSTENAIEYLKNLDDVLIVEPNYKREAYSAPISGVANPLFSQQWAIQATRIDELWKVPTITNKRPVIAIIDSGLDIDHEEFSGNLWVNEAEANGKPGVDDDGNGYIDDIHGFDMVLQSGVITDPLGHGTHCAGIAAAKDNNRGIVGMNPDALIMPVRGLDANGYCEEDVILEAVNYAIANGADIISLSFGGINYSKIESETYTEASKHSIIVAAAGNESRDINLAVSFPAAYPSVLGVMSSDSISHISYFSNTDEDGPFHSNLTNELETYNYELYAPGSGIVSTYPSGYVVQSGTSMATPCVAGIISRLLQCKNYNDRQTLKLDLINACKSGCIDAMKAYEGHKASDFTAYFTAIKYTDENGKDLNQIEKGSTVYAYPILVNYGEPVDNIKISINDAFGFSVNEEEFTIDHIGTGDTIQAGPIKFTVNDEEELYSDTISFDVTTTIGKETNVYHKKLYVLNKYIYDSDPIIKNGHTTILKGFIDIDTTLFIPEGDTLIIEPSTFISLSNNADLICEGKLVCKIKKPSESYLNSSITIMGYNAGLISFKDTLKYVSFLKCDFEKDGFVNGNFKSCEFTDISGNGLFAQNCSFDYCKISCRSKHLFKDCKFSNSTLTNLVQTDTKTDAVKYLPNISSMNACNCFDNTWGKTRFSVAFYSNTAAIETTDHPSYLGSDDDEELKISILDANNPYMPIGKGTVDISNKLDKYSTTAPPELLHLYLNGDEIKGDVTDKSKAYPILSNIKFVFSAPVKQKTPDIYDMYDVVWESDSIVNGKIFLRNGYVTYHFSDCDDFFSSSGEFTIPNLIYQKDEDILEVNCLQDTLIKLIWDRIEETKNYNKINVYGINIWQGQMTYTLINEIPIDSTEMIIEEENRYSGYCIKLANDNEEEEMVYNIVFDICDWIDDGEAYCVTPPIGLEASLYIINFINGVIDIDDLYPDIDIEGCFDYNSDGKLNIQDFAYVYSSHRNENDSTTSENAIYSIEDSILYVDSDIPISTVEAYFEADNCSFETLSGLDNMEHFIRELKNGDYQLLAYSFNGGNVPVGKQPLLKLSNNAHLKNILLTDKNGVAFTLKEVAFVPNIQSEPSESEPVTLHYYTVDGREVSPSAINSNSGVYIKVIEKGGKLDESTKFKIKKQ